MRGRYFFVGVLCLLTLCGCGLGCGIEQRVPEDFTVGLVRTSGSRNRSDILLMPRWERFFMPLWYMTDRCILYPRDRQTEKI